jgi:hypothetical protein
MAVYTANDTYNQPLTGGAEADTFYAGRNSVIVTSGGGGDTIVFQHLPWNSTGHIRDFALGVDKLDFSALFAASGYTGNDPVRDGYLRFESDGAGGTQLWYDPDAAGTAYRWPTLVTTLDNINPSGLTWAQLSNPTPPPPPPPEGHRVELSDGGHAIVGFTNFQDAVLLTIDVFDASGALEEHIQGPQVTRDQVDVVSSPLGGFLVAARFGVPGQDDLQADVYLNLYDNSGTALMQTRLGGGLPDVSVRSYGTFGVSWTDEGTPRSLVIDPRNPPDLSQPATPQVTLLDNVAPVTGQFPLFSWTNDTTPTLRVTVTEVGELDLTFNTVGDPAPNRSDFTIAITAEDVTRGYIDVPATALSGERTYFGVARITDVNGVVSLEDDINVNVDTVAPAAPSITNVTDDAGPTTGNVPPGGTTDDNTPTLQIALGPYTDFRWADQLQLFVDGSPVGSPVDVNMDLQRGYTVITSPALSQGTHTFSARLTDGAGNVSALASPYTVTVQSDSNSPPVVTVGDHSLGINGSAQIQGWIAYSDANGNPATQYQFWDQGIAANSGFFSTPSNAHHPSETVITVNAADLANVLVHGGQVAGSENLWVRAFDGTDWSQWDSFNFTTVGNSPPVATVGDHSLAANQWAQVQGWISYSDADGNAATQYQFWDQGIAANSAYFWTPSNPHHPSETLITVNAADLANVWVRGGQVAGSENLWVRAFDGTAWSAWDAWNMSTFA